MISWIEKHNRICWLATFSIAILIFYVSSLTFESGGSSGILSIIYHILIFFVFALFLMMALAKGDKNKFIFLALITAILYGITDEIHQFFVPGRAMSVQDIFLDSVGTIFAFMVYLISFEKRKR